MPSWPSALSGYWCAAKGFVVDDSGPHAEANRQRAHPAALAMLREVAGRLAERLRAVAGLRARGSRPARTARPGRSPTFFQGGRAGGEGKAVRSLIRTRCICQRERGSGTSPATSSYSLLG